MGTRHYGSLDAVRGVCALLVMILHSNFLSGVQLVPLAYLAVDLFFVMSGFVLGLAYDARLRGGGFLRGFVRRRFLRLGPMWAVGLGIGLLAAAAGERTVGGALLLLGSFGFSLFFLPNIFSTVLFPLNQPGWSLFYELVANLFYAATARYLTKGVLLAVVAASACLLIVLGLRRGTLDGGTLWANLDISLARVFFAFFVGLLIQRTEGIRAHGGGRGGPRLALVLAVLVAVLSADVRGAGRIWYELGTVLLVLPAVVAACVRWERGPSAATDLLGNLSYPLYATHVGVFAIARIIWSRAYDWETPMPAWLVLAILTSCVAIAFLLGTLVDPPVQRFLNGVRSAAATITPRRAERA